MQQLVHLRSKCFQKRRIRTADVEERLCLHRRASHSALRKGSADDLGCSAVRAAWRL
jgi:hypothetical protein